MEFMLQVLVSLCVISFSVESRLIGSQRPIIALVGDDVILPCHLDPPFTNATNETVVWTRPDLDPPYVHFHQDGRLIVDHKHPDYYFRTTLFVDELRNGNVSVKIFDVKPSDAGTYCCSLPSMQKEASIQLIVMPAGNVNQTKLTYNFSETTDKTVIIAVVIGISGLLTVVTIIVIYLVFRKNRPNRAEALSGVAQTMDVWASFTNAGLTVCEGL